MLAQTCFKKLYEKEQKSKSTKMRTFIDQNAKWVLLQVAAILIISALCFATNILAFKLLFLGIFLSLSGSMMILIQENES